MLTRPPVTFAITAVYGTRYSELPLAPELLEVRGIGLPLPIG